MTNRKRCLQVTTSPGHDSTAALKKSQVMSRHTLALQKSSKTNPSLDRAARHEVSHPLAWSYCQGLLLGETESFFFKTVAPDKSITLVKGNTPKDI